MADQKIYVLDDDGTLTMLAYSKTEYKQLAQHKVLDGHDAWGPIALVGNRMLLRDSTRMVCIEVGEVMPELSRTRRGSGSSRTIAGPTGEYALSSGSTFCLGVSQ
jgi:hypothetical protein